MKGVRELMANNEHSDKSKNELGKNESHENLPTGERFAAAKNITRQRERSSDAQETGNDLGGDADVNYEGNTGGSIPGQVHPPADAI